MAVTTAALSGSIKDLGLEIPDHYLARVVLVVEANTPGSLLRDTSGNTLLAGAKRIAVDKTTGAFSQTLVTTDSADIQPADDRLYKATLIYPSGRPGAKNELVESGWFPLTADAPLASKWGGIQVTAVSTALYESISMSVASAEASAVAAAAGAESSAASATLAQTLVTSDLGTTDGQSFALVSDLNSQTGGALNAMYGQGVNVTADQFGATGDGTTDDTAAIQAAINFVAALGGGTVRLPGAIISTVGNYKIAATLTNTSANVLLLGDGGDSSHDTGTFLADAATVLTWAGAAGGTMVSFASPTIAGAQTRTGGGVKGIAFDAGTTVAGTGLAITSWRDGRFDDLYFHEFSTTDILVTASTGGGEARDSQRNRFTNIRFRQVVAGGCFLTLDGTTTANASLNYFENCQGNFTGCTTTGAYNLRNNDDNLFVRCGAYMATSGTSLVCHAGATTAEAARSNVFVHFSTNGAILCNGTEEAASPSVSNVFHDLDSDNNTPTPTLGTGATARWSFTNGLHKGGMYSNLSVADSLTNTTAARDSLTGSLRVINGGENHVQLASPDLAAKWGIAVLGSGGHLRFTPLAGTGRVILNSDLAVLGNVGFYNTTPIAKQTGVAVTAAGIHAALVNLGLIGA